MNRRTGAAGVRYQERQNRLLARTITQKPLILAIHGRVIRLGFRDVGRASSAVLRTTYGLIDLYFSQVYGAESSGRNVRLHLTDYAYSLRPHDHQEPMFRWEYVRSPGPEARWCRHHLQGPHELDLEGRGGAAVNLNDWHLPTGPVPVEEIIRFCIVDLGVTPLDDGWDAILRRSLDDPIDGQAD